MPGNRKLMTSKSVFERLRWDPNFRTDAIVVVFEDRFLGEQNRAFDSFNPARIPFSRVVRFLRDDEVLWDRKRRLDRIFGSGETLPNDRLELRGQETSPSELGKDAHDVGAACFNAAEQQWRSQTLSLGSTQSGQLRILSFNVLHDTYDDGELRSAERRPLLLRTLKDANADLIGLQEVTPEHAADLLTEPWIRSDYAVSQGRESNSPNGLMLLSRHPISRVIELRSGPRAFAQVAIVAHPVRKRLVVGVVHLTSDHHKTAIGIRRQQISKILGAIDLLGQGANATVLMGDFNFGDEHVEANLSEHSLWDVWPRLHPGVAGFTFDPTANAIAAANSTTGRSRRLDRVFLDGIDVADVSLTIIEPQDEAAKLNASDHHGLELCIASPSENVEEAAPTHRSAVVLLVPNHLQHDIQARRRQSDRSFDRWMPHINLLYGFIPDRLFERAAEIIKDVLGQFSPFDVSLDQLKTFAHRQSTTVWLAPSPVPEGVIGELQACLAAAFPNCVEQSQKSAEGFTPHLSVGQLRGDARQQPSAIEDWQGAIRPVRFSVASVALISRRADEPFEVRHVVPFGGDTASREIQRATNTRLPSANDIRQSVKRELESIGALSDASVHLTGSARYADRLAGGDVDLVVRTQSKLGNSTLLDCIADQLNGGAARSVESARVADDAVMPSVRTTIDGRNVDIMVASPGPGSAPADSAIELADWLDERQNGADGLLFGATLRAVRLFASRRQIDKQALGFPGGVGWALLAADAFFSRPQQGDEVLATIRGIHARLTSRRATPLRSPVTPFEEILRTLAPPSRRIVVVELEGALDQSPIVWPQLFASVDPWRHPSVLGIEIEGSTSKSARAGWLAKVALSAINVLAKGKTPVRPYMVCTLSAPMLLLGLESAELSLGTLERLEAHLGRLWSKQTDSGSGPRCLHLNSQAARERWSAPNPQPRS